MTTPLAVRGATGGSYSFTVAHPSPFPERPPPAPKPASKKSPENDLLHFVTRPDLTPPNITVPTTPETRRRATCSSRLWAATRSRPW